ncbi:MAG: hypothetical protein HDR24_08330 [Lachnospiraceae bacterium]|nr:hypothetical protein [Lachnospiraceae bacterium]
MDGEYISLREHEAFERRMDEANDRQSKRISILEDEVKELREISSDIKSLLVEMKGMREEQEKQGVRLATLEGRDGEKWRDTAKDVLSVIIGAIIAFVLMKVGLGT